LKNQCKVLDYRFKEDGHPRHKESRNVENVLVLQGGGSLGAFACGVFKALVKKNVRVDIVAGTSIGAVNAAIIVGSKSGHPEKDLEDFWIELAESSLRLITRHIQLIEHLYDILEKKVDLSQIDRQELEKIKSEYNMLINNYGAQIKSVTRILRSVLESPTILQNADFSPKTIKELITQGERKTMEKLSYCESIKYEFNG
jgi:predicted acylesterase/phospholipase RssA